MVIYQSIDLSESGRRADLRRRSLNSPENFASVLINWYLLTAAREVLGTALDSSSSLAVLLK